MSEDFICKIFDITPLLVKEIQFDQFEDVILLFKSFLKSDPVSTSECLSYFSEIISVTGISISTFVDLVIGIMECKECSFREILESLKTSLNLHNLGGFIKTIDYLALLHQENCHISNEFIQDIEQVINKNEKSYYDLIKQFSKDLVIIDPLLVHGFVRGTLFFDIARIAKHHKPKIMILENVKNICKIDNGKTFKKILDVLEKDLNYSVFHKILIGNQFGVPQKRERVFILCFHKDLSVSDYEFTIPDLKPLKLEDILEKDIKDKHLFIERDDISLRDIEPEVDMFGNFPNKPIRIGSMNKGGQGERIYHPYGNAITLSAYGGGPGKKTGAYLIDGKVRKLSPRECARLMGFPEDFKICENLNQSYTQFGNAVIVNIVQYILKDLIDKKIL